MSLRAGWDRLSILYRTFFVERVVFIQISVRNRRRYNADGFDYHCARWTSDFADRPTVTCVALKTKSEKPQRRVLQVLFTTRPPGPPCRIGRDGVSLPRRHESLVRNHIYRTNTRGRPREGTGTSVRARGRDEAQKSPLTISSRRLGRSSRRLFRRLVAHFFRPRSARRACSACCS